jgi:hypothetical protein
MKRYLSAITAIAAAFAMISCEGQDPTPAPAPGTMTISVDKTQIESDGVDIATFTIKDANGNVLTTEANKGSVYFKNVKTEKRLPRYSTGFTSIVDGEFEFVVIYNGEETSNSVKIQSVNREKYEVFHRNVAIFKLTGTWCTNCPRMTTALHSLDEDAADHSIVLACHSESQGHPFYVQYGTTDLASAVFLAMGETSAAYPTNCYDMTSLNTSSSTIAISDEIMTRRIDAPAAAGIAVSSVALEGTSLKVKAKVKASVAGTYDAVCAIKADDLFYEGGYCDNEDNLYSDVVLAISGDNFFSYRANSSFDLAKDQEFEREFTFEFGEAPSQSLLDKVSAVILLHKKNADGSSEVNNCAECAYGKTLDYRYN